MNSPDGTSARVVSSDEDDDTIELELSESAMLAFAAAASWAEADSEGAPAAEPLEPEAGATPQEAGPPTAELLEPDADAGGQERPSATERSHATQRPATTQRPMVGPALQKTRPRFALALASGVVAAALLGGAGYLIPARASRAAPVPVPLAAAASDVGRGAAALEIPPPATTTDDPVRFKNPFDASEVFEFPAGTTFAEAREAVAELLSQRARERQILLVKKSRGNGKTADRDTPVNAGRVTPRG